jgi:hypothetical protein
MHFAMAGGKEYSRRMSEPSEIDRIADQLAINKQLRRRFQGVAATGAMLLLLVLGIFVARLCYYAWSYDTSQLQALVTVEAKRVGEVEKKFWKRELDRIKENDLPILWNELLTKLEQKNTANEAVALLRTVAARPRYALADAMLASFETRLLEMESREILIAELRSPQTRERLAAVLGQQLDLAREELSDSEEDALAAGLVDGIVTLLKER